MTDLKPLSIPKTGWVTIFYKICHFNNSQMIFAGLLVLKFHATRPDTRIFNGAICISDSANPTGANCYSTWDGNLSTYMRNFVVDGIISFHFRSDDNYLKLFIITHSDPTRRKGHFEKPIKVALMSAKCVWSDKESSKRVEVSIP